MCAKKEDKNIYYTVEGASGLSIGEEVVVKIDWDRRYKLMKLHFAAEIVLQLFIINFLILKNLERILRQIKPGWILSMKEI